MPSKDAGEYRLTAESFRLGPAASRTRDRGLQRPRSPSLVLTPSRSPPPSARPVAVVETPSPSLPAREPAIVTVRIVPETAARAAAAPDPLDFAAFSSPTRRETTPVWMPDLTPGDIKVAWMPQLMMTG
jgi:hypothetical protein